MKKKFIPLIPYIIVFLVDFYILPFLMKDTGTAMLFMLCIMPLAAFSAAVVYGVRRGFCTLLPIAAFVLFFPSIFIYYNISAWSYAVVYAVIVAAGNGIGRIFYRKR